MPRTSFIRRNKRGEKSLPLEGKVVRLKPDRMRSKRSIITISWYNAATFDLIRHAERRDTVVAV